jgi:hypothetical protein
MVLARGPFDAAPNIDVSTSSTGVDCAATLPGASIRAPYATLPLAEGCYWGKRGAARLVLVADPESRWMIGQILSVEDGMSL